MNLICCLIPGSPLSCDRRAFEQSTAFCVRVWFRGITICLPYLEIGQNIQELKWLRLPRQKSKFEECNAVTQL